MSQELIGIRETARRLGVSDTAVHKAIKSGRVKVAGKHPTNGRPLLAWPQVESDWLNHTDNSKRTHVGPTGTSKVRSKYAADTPEVHLPTVNDERPSAPPPVADAPRKPDDQGDAVAVKSPNINQSRAVKEAYAARLAKLDYEERIGKLVPAEQVKVDAFKVARSVRDALMNIPDRVSNLLAAETDPAKVHAMLADEIRIVLSKLSLKNG